MKTNKSLLVKFLTVLCALCFSLSLVFGLVGCGEDVKSIVKTEIKNGELIVTYSDNTTENLGKVVGEDGKDGQDGEDGKDGAQGGTLKADCTHVFATNVYKFATCKQEGLSIKLCVKCLGYELEKTPVDPDNHGEYKLVKNGDVVDLVFDDSCVVDVQQDPFELANGACPKQKCTLCNEDLKQHADFVWVVADSKVNACENEHLEIHACPDCKAVADDTRVAPAKGHNYNKETAVIAKVGADYKVTLTCADCNETTTLTAVFVSEQVANCGQGGFKLYKYTFNNFDFMATVPADKNETVEFKVEETGKTNAHKIGDYAIAQGETVEFIPGYKALIDAGKILWSEGQPGACNEHKVAGFFCELCSTAEKQVLITFNLSGEHVFTAVQPADCVTDGYYDCDNCTYTYKADELLAKGHNYTYVPDSINVAAKTIKVKCSCGSEITANLDNGTVYTAQNCKDKSKTTYKTVGLTNGLPTGHKNLKDVVISVVVEATEQKAHTLAEGYKYKQGETVDYLPAFDALVDAGKLLWTEGEPGACNQHKAAGFFCTECNNLVTINLSGKHDFTGNDEVKATVDCVNRVANTTKCNSCNGDIVTSYTGAKGHELVADTTDWNAFMADPANNKTVTFACTCGFSTDLTAVVATRVENNQCVQTNVTVYTFTYNYTIKDAANDDVAKSFVVVEEFGVSTGKHSIGGLKFTQGETVEYNDDIDALVDAGKILWTEGEPGACNVHKTAGFFCEVCSTAEKQVLITIQLSGEHDIANSVLNETKYAPDCVNDGWSFKECATCHTEVKIADLPAIDHEIEYVATGYSAVDNANIVPGKAIGTCTRPTCGMTVEVEGEVLAGSLVESNCMNAGTVTFTYVDDNGVKVCDDVVVTIPKVAQHVAHTTGTPIEIEIDTNGDGVKEKFYFCTGCNGYVKIA
ncbi:MAG: hypothetical protein IKA85_04990 [Clostridia bacterium]|nr:hypothetical protein [Clostridia bacterium]